MSDELNEEGIKKKIWEHIAIKPDTFAEFRRLKIEKKFRTDDEFILHILEQIKVTALEQT